MVVDWSQCPVLESVPDKVSGAWVFRGTRVPVSVILQNLKHLGIGELVTQYPSVSREQIEAVLSFLSVAAEPILIGAPNPDFVTYAHPSR